MNRRGVSMEVSCPYSTDIKKGLREYKFCTIISQMCPFMRICATKNKVVHTEKANNCEVRMGGGVSES